MLNKLFFCFLCVSSSLFSEIDVQKCINKIRQLPEACEMMRAIHNEGPIRIAVSHHPLAQQFGAYWDVDQRVICVCPTFHHSEGDLIGSILFEMHNAFNNEKIEHYYTLAAERKIDRDAYIEGIEYIEYLNSKSTALMAEKGVQTGLFPKETRRNTYRDFEEHFYYQQYGGHSDWIGRTYDSLVK